MDGPLVGMEDYIRDIDIKERLAYMKIQLGLRPTKLGLTILGKRVWYPKDEAAPSILPSGTVVDCESLAKKMMGIS